MLRRPVNIGPQLPIVFLTEGLLSETSNTDLFGGISTPREALDYDRLVGIQTLRNDVLLGTLCATVTQTCCPALH
jgi:hypothetical protein